MKLRIEVDGAEYTFESNVIAGRSEAEHGEIEYKVSGDANASGQASISEVGPGLFSVLLGNRSFTVSVLDEGEEFLAAVHDRNYRIVLADPRDRSAKLKKQAVAGPVELRAQMPGKVIQFLVEPGTRVVAGQSLVVVEAMKMQNEMKSPKDGVVSRIFVSEGATVAAGDPLLRLE